MRTLSRLLLACLLAALAVPALASAAPGATRGVVVQRDARAGAVVLANKSGNLQRVKVAKMSKFTMGAIVQVRGAKISVVGHSHKAKLHGVVVRRTKGSFALAGGGSVLAVASVTPPAAGDQVTTTVQVGPSAAVRQRRRVPCRAQRLALGEGARNRDLVDATTLALAVPGFPAGLPIAVGGLTLPVLAPNTAVEARVTLGPDPANPNAIILTLVSLRLDDGQHGDHGDQNGAMVKAEGSVTALTEATGVAAGSITIDGEHGTVMFTIPAGFGATGLMVGDDAEAWGTPGVLPTDPATLVRLEGSNGGDGQSGHGHDGGGGDNSGGSGNDD